MSVSVTMPITCPASVTGSAPILWSSMRRAASAASRSGPTVITIGPDRPARDGAQLMLDHKIGALPVLEDGHLVGIITETDVVRAFVRATASASTFRH